MDYTKEVIFSSLEEAIDFYKKQGFILTDDKHLVLNKKVHIEIILHKMGPQLLRSSIEIKEDYD